MKNGTSAFLYWSFCALVMGFGLVSPAEAQRKVVPQSRADVIQSFSPVVKRVAPAVVNVYVKRRVQQRRSPIFDDPFFRRFLGRGFRIPRRRLQNSLGSGVIVSPEGVVVTNFHVIKGGVNSNIKVAFADKREFSAQIVLKDERTDLAVLRINGEGEKFPFLEIEDSDRLEVGDLVLAIGNPFGVGQTVTSGIVSALARTRVGISDYQFFIQTDAAINPGNSGGALVDMNGRLVGINTAIFSRSGGSHGIGFAIPSNMARVVIQSALQGKTVKRPWFGAKLQPVTSDIADSLGIDRPSGALVINVHKGSPADRARLRQGDVIVGVDDRKVTDPSAFRYRFATKGVGGQAQLKIIRSGALQEVRVDLRAAPENPPRNITLLKGRNPFAGAQVANLSPALAEEHSFDEFSGVVILKIRRGSLAHNIRRLRTGDIILKVNGQNIANVRELRGAISRPQRSWRFSIKRRGRVFNTVIGR